MAERLSSRSGNSEQPGVADVLRSAARWSVAGFLVTLGLFTVGAIIYRTMVDTSEVFENIVRSLIPSCIVGMVFFAARFLLLSRSLLARMFAVTAFASTFFGLAMLLVLFIRLLGDAKSWFELMPDRIAERNEQLLRTVGSVDDVRKVKHFLEGVEQITQKREQPDADRWRALSQLASKALEAGLLPSFAEGQIKNLETQLAGELATAATEEEKKQIRQDYEEIRARKVIDLVPSLRENVVLFEKDYRPHTGPASLLMHFFTSGPSNSPEDGGIMPALLGSTYLALLTVFVAVPLGVGTAVYLEEYSRGGWFARVVQTNINNLAGVPSVVYGILGAFLFVELIFKPMESETIKARNVLGGGLTLGFLTLPVVIVAAQEAIRAVPVSIRHAALALGATRWQVVRHHVLPNATPGILTGTILAMSRALGEAAPLVFFGALLYVDHPPSLFSQFTVLPMQIFGWTARPDLVWQYNSAMASLVLLFTLLTLNAVAIYLRQRAQRERKW